VHERGVKALQTQKTLFMIIGGTGMKIKIIKEKNVDIAVIASDEILLTDVQSSLDLMASVGYETDCTRIVLNKSAVCEDFFQLRTRLAGEILQKFVNYHVKLAIVGDFSQYESKALRDFIYESNPGKHVFFVSDEKQAVEKLCSA
jgi:hypothetical protein